MATIRVTAVFVAAAAAGPSPALGLPCLRVAKAAKLSCRCSYSKDLKKKASSDLALAVIKGAPLLAETSAMMVAAGPMLALTLVLAQVDEQMWTVGAEVSNNLLGWILVVTFCLVLSYIVYSSILNDDDDLSGTGGITI